jgi:AbiU2
VGVNPNLVPLLELDRQLEIVTQQVIRARIYFDLWWFYKGAETRPKIIDTLNDFSDFFRFDEHAQFVAMIIHCGAIWDNTKSALGLVRLAGKILDPKKSESDQVILDKIANYQNDAAGLVMIRNEAIAHRSATFDYAEAFTRAKVVPSNLPHAMTTRLMAINELRTRRNLYESVFATVPLEHLRRLLNSLGGPDLNAHSDVTDLFRNSL